MRRNLFCLGFAIVALVVAAPTAFADECDFGPSAGAVPPSALECAADITMGGPPRFDPTDTATSPDGVLATCASMTLNDPNNVSTVGSVDFRPACDFAGDDFSTLFCADFAVPANLTAIDPVTCSESVVCTLSNSQNPSGFAWDPSTGTMYMSTTDVVTSQLWSIDDLGSCASTLIGTMSDSPGNISIAFNKNGDLFGHDIVTDGLHAIDKGNANSTLLGSVGFDANFAQGMDCDAADDTCYIFGFNNNAFQAELWTVDTSNGAGNFVGVIGPLGQLTEWTGPGIMATNDGGCALTATVGAAGIGSGGLLPVDLHLMHVRDRGVTRTFKIWLVNAAGEIVAKMRTPEVRIRPNKLMKESFELRIPSGTPAGDYTLQVAIGGMEQGQVAAEAAVSIR